MQNKGSFIYILLTLAYCKLDRLVFRNLFIYVWHESFNHELNLICTLEKKLDILIPNNSKNDTSEIYLFLTIQHNFQPFLLNNYLWTPPLIFLFFFILNYIDENRTSTAHFSISIFDTGPFERDIVHHIITTEIYLNIPKSKFSLPPL